MHFYPVAPHLDPNPRRPRPRGALAIRMDVRRARRAHPRRE